MANNMINIMLRKVFGTRNQRILTRLNKWVVAINALEPSYQALSDEVLRGKTVEFRQRLNQGETLNDLLVEAFAAVREASRRTLGLRHFDVQLLGGMVLHGGKIAEMGTGEGKTLAATLAAYLNALSGKGVHIVTVNDYLAKRDAEWMQPIYEFLGLTVGVILADMFPVDKRVAYAADVTYGTNNEFGFDYLRDNMAFALENRVQRSLHYAIVDEVDSILIDEARTPLIISGPMDEQSDLYAKMNVLIPHLTLAKQIEMEGDAKKELKDKDLLGDYTLDEKAKQVHLTEEGHEHIEKLFLEHGLLRLGESLYDAGNIILMHHLNAALRAHLLFHNNVDYIVQNGEVIIIDEHTGRAMPGRRWSDGLHQAVEAKEGMPIHSENQTLASITFQNYFRLYDHLAGMTGTADTEAYELQQIYGLEVVVVPTNKPTIRKDFSDQIYLSAQAKFAAILKDIKERHQHEQPVLVGTPSIENSEYLSALLQKEKIPHQVLNAKQHAKEALIIAQAGRPGAVTIATNMAGRGTDIVLGGAMVEGEKEDWQVRHDKVLALGGLHVLGTERNESRRIDNQLRGRSGRQGDPGSSQFYLSLEDNLMRIFASGRVAVIMKRLGMKEDEAIQHSLVTRAIENAQRKVEGHNFDIRKQLLQFDDVANDQRKVIYEQRTDVMLADSIIETIMAMREAVVAELVHKYLSPDNLENPWDINGLASQLKNDFHLQMDFSAAEDERVREEFIQEQVVQAMKKNHQEKEEKIGSQAMRQLEKTLLLQSLDLHWKEHLAAMDYLRQGIHLRGYVNKNPTQEYKRESFLLFTQMLEAIKYDVMSTLNRIELSAQEDVELVEQQRRQQTQSNLSFEHPSDVGDAQENREILKVGRNDSCPCGSGKKFKHCHGQIG